MRYFVGYCWNYKYFTLEVYKQFHLEKNLRMAQSTMLSVGSEVEIKVRYDRHGSERVCVFFEHLANLACHSIETFSRLVRANVPHLGCLPTLRISFLDKDSDWVELTDTSFPKFVKSVRCDMSEDPKLQIKVVDGASPAVIKPPGTQYRPGGIVPTASSSKRSLDGDFDTCAKKKNKAYVSPIEMDINLKEDELAQKEYEYNEYSARYSSLEESFGLNIVVDKSIPVCGRCHLRVSKGHNKRNCQNRACDDIRQCGNLDFHADKKAELKEYEKLRDQAGACVKKINEELTAKRRVRESMTNTFESKIHTHLINSNPDKYLIDGVRVRNIAVNADKAVLRKHYNGRVPLDLDVAAATFQTVIDSFENRHKKAEKPKTQHINPTLELLKNNSQYNVVVPQSMDPSFSSTSVTLPNSSIQPPPPMYYQYPPMFPYFWYGGQFGPEMSSPPPPTSPPPLPPPPPPEEPEAE